MTLGETIISVWQQALADKKVVVDLEGKEYAVGLTRAKKLRAVRFAYDTYQLDGIEQNPETGSRWAILAREGKRVMQFSYEHRYVANICEGKLTRYPAWFALKLPK